MRGLRSVYRLLGRTESLLGRTWRPHGTLLLLPPTRITPAVQNVLPNGLLPFFFFFFLMTNSRLTYS